MDVTSIHLYVSIFLTPVKVYVISTGKLGIDNVMKNNVGHFNNQPGNIIVITVIRFIGTTAVSSSSYHDCHGKSS